MMPAGAEEARGNQKAALAGVVHDAKVYIAEMCSGSEAGSYLRLIDSCITQLKTQGPSRTCNESKEEEVYLGQAMYVVCPGLEFDGVVLHSRHVNWRTAMLRSALSRCI